jgi:predicted transcriptional regulator
MKISRSPPIPRPSDGELAILQVLWRLGPSTVRQVQEVLDAEQPTGYTTILKQLQIMTGKGLVSRDESNRTHVYRAAEQAQKTQRRLLGDLVERAFGGSTAQVMMQSLSLKRATAAELDEIRNLLDEMQARNPRRRS